MAEERMETSSPILPPPFRPIIGQPLSTLDEWLKVFEEYVELKQITDEKEKNMLLIGLQSEPVRGELKILCYPIEPSSLPYFAIVNTLKTIDDDSVKALIGSRFRFFRSRQGPSQSLLEYAEHLRTLAEHCHFPSEAIHEDALARIFRLRIYDRNIKEKLEMIKDEQYGLEKILEFAMQLNEPIPHPLDFSDKTTKPSPKPTKLSQRSPLSADEMMDSFYPNWWSELSTETVCIPACLDVVTNAYLGPSDPLASNYIEKLFSKKKRFYEGQNAEDTFLRAFQKLNLGGVLVCGFNSAEFAAKKNKIKSYKKFGIEGFEIDAIFIHPRMGIFAFEIKATKKIQSDSDIPVFINQYKKAESQLNKMKKQIQKIFEKICNCSQYDAKNIALHLSICFPFAGLDDQKRNSFIHIDESHFDDQEIMKKLFTSRMTFKPEKIELLDELKKFACAIAGYRSAEFMLAGCNALEVHKVIDLQNFDGGIEKSGCDIFWTNEQLAIFECNDRHQIIYGPPGTGKTLVLIQKAYQAAQLMKDGGSLYILTSQPELLLRFKKHFKNIDEKLVRPPIVIRTFKDIPPLNREDDIFIDEFIVAVRALHAFVSTCDNVVIVANGYAQPNTTQDIEDYRNTKGLEKENTEKLFDQRQENGNNCSTVFAHIKKNEKEH